MRFELSAALMSGYLLALARATAWVFVAPPFGNKLVPTSVKIALGAALALAMGPRMAVNGAGAIGEGGFATAPFFSAVVLQLAAGAALGYLGVLLFGAVQAAGGLIDLFGGFTMAQLFDPMSNAGASVFGRLYSIMGVTILFAIDGHLMIIRGLIESVAAAPLTNLSLDAMRTTLTTGIGHFLIAAAEIAAPLLAALVLSEIALGLLSRAAPQMNVLMLSMPAKALLCITLGAAALPLLPDAVRALVSAIVHGGRSLNGP